MKKLISLALAVFMIIGLSTAVFAETVTVVPGTNTADVKGSYVEGYDGNGIVYSVNIEWTDLNFTYHAEKGAVWDPNELKYSEVEEAYWEGEGKITVTNRSNTKILAVPEYAANAGYEDATMTFDTDKLRVETAELGAEQTGTITVTPDGFLPAMDGEETIGTITIKIEQDMDVNLREVQALIADVRELRQDAESNGVYAENDDEFNNMVACLGHLTTTRDALQSENQADWTDSEQAGLNRAYASLLEAYNTCAALMQ